MSGECLACLHVGNCKETSLEKVLSSFTCPMFTAVPEPVFLARLTTMNRFGEKTAVLALMAKPEDTLKED